MQIRAYAADVETAIREQGVDTEEIGLAYVDGSYNHTYDGESTWRRGHLAARILKKRKEELVIQWLHGANLDHSSPIAGKDTPQSVARQIVATLRRGF
jgi:hypothetical protein